jgi:17 kDa outer membrane surface antigen
MSRRTRSYTGRGSYRQMPALRGLTVAVLAVSLGGCAGLGLPFSEPGTDGQLSANGTGTARLMLASAVVSDRVDASDWESVRRTIESAPSKAIKLGWNNAATGSLGSVTVASSDGSGCRLFAATVNDARGIRRYRGESCEDVDGHAQIHGVMADDATLL